MKDNMLPIMYFLHIPKTAGTTFRTISCYNYENIYELDGMGVFKKNLVLKNIHNKKVIDLKDEKENEEIENSIEFINGNHMGFGIHKYFNKNLKYLTFLRNPVDRIISNYYFRVANVKRISKHHSLLQSYKDDGFLIKGNSGVISLEDYISTDGLDNLQTRMISGKGGIWRQDISTVVEDDFKRAIENINKHFIFTGITEEFDKSLLFLKKKLGWDFIYYNRRNYTTEKKSKSEIDSRIINIIKERNKFDIKLYEYVKNNIFERYVEEYKNDLEKNISQFKKTNELYQIVHKNTISKPITALQNRNNLLKNCLVRKNKDVSLIEYFKKFNYQNIGIYGMGTMKSLLVNELETDKEIKINYIIDKNTYKHEYNGMKYLTLDNFKNEIHKINIDVIVVTPMYAFEEIKDKLIKIGVKSDIVSLQDLLD